MEKNPTARWFPRLVGGLLALLAIGTWNFAPSADSVILPGYVVGGSLGRTLGALQIVLLGLLSWGCFACRSFAPPALLAFVTYTVVALWVWVGWFADPGQGSMTSLALVTAFLSLALLAFGRALWQRRAAFDR